MSVLNIVRPVYAEFNFGDPTTNPFARFSSITIFVNLIVPIMMIGGGLATLVMLFLGAYTYITSEGSAEKVKKAQSILMYAVLGLFLIVASYILTKIIGFVLKVPMPL